MGLPYLLALLSACLLSEGQYIHGKISLVLAIAHFIQTMAATRIGMPHHLYIDAKVLTLG